MRMHMHAYQYAVPHLKNVVERLHGLEGLLHLVDLILPGLADLLLGELGEVFVRLLSLLAHVLPLVRRHLSRRRGGRWW